MRFRLQVLKRLAVAWALSTAAIWLLLSGVEASGWVRLAFREGLQWHQVQSVIALLGPALLVGVGLGTGLVFSDLECSGERLGAEASGARGESWLIWGAGAALILGMGASVAGLGPYVQVQSPPGIFVAQDKLLLRADSQEGDLLKGVTLLSLGNDGGLLWRLSAPSAHWNGARWRIPRGRRWYAEGRERLEVDSYLPESIPGSAKLMSLSQGDSGGMVELGWSAAPIQGAALLRWSLGWFLALTATGGALGGRLMAERISGGGVGALVGATLALVAAVAANFGLGMTAIALYICLLTLCIVGLYRLLWPRF